MSVKNYLHALVKQFADKKLTCCITLKKDIDHTPTGDSSSYLLKTDDDGIKALALTKEQQDQLVVTCEKLIFLSFKKQKVLKFTSITHVRTYMFEVHKDFLITIRNHGIGHLFQTYEIIITVPK